MSKKNYDVSPNGGKWQVKEHGKSRATKNFDTQKEAISYGKRKAKEGKGELYIKNRQGQIRKTNSYGDDPFPPNG